MWDKSDIIAFVILSFVVFILWSIASCSTGYKIAMAKHQQEAIDRNYAHYNPTTGEWEWIEFEKVKG